MWEKKKESSNPRNLDIVKLIKIKKNEQINRKRRCIS